MGTTPLRHLVRNLLRLSASDWRDAARAEWHLLRAALTVRTAPVGALMHGWTADAAQAGVTQPAPDRTRAHRVATTVRRVARYGPIRAACLTRSLAICRFLGAEGIHGAVVRIGVRPEGTRLEAHAWVEFGGEVIGDSVAHVSRFAELASTQPVPAGSRWT